jgi:hypothetical protein
VCHVKKSVDKRMLYSYCMRRMHTFYSPDLSHPTARGVPAKNPQNAPLNRTLALLRFVLLALPLLNLQQARREFSASPLIAILSAAPAFMIVMCLALTSPIRHLKAFVESNDRDPDCGGP